MIANLYSNYEFPLNFHDLTCLTVDSKNKLLPFYRNDCIWQSFDFNSNSVINTSAQLEYTSTLSPCYQIILRSGLELNLSENQLVFCKKSGWKKAKYLDKHDQILGPSFNDIWGESVFNPEMEFNHFLVTLELKDIVTEGRKDLIVEFLKFCWNVLGRLNQQTESLILQFDSLTSKGSKNTLKFSIKKIQYLLQKLGVVSWLDHSLNLVICGDTNRNLFLYQMQVVSLLIDVPSPRRWELITSFKRIGEYPTYYLNNSSSDNVIVNNLVLNVKQ